VIYRLFRLKSIIKPDSNHSQKGLMMSNSFQGRLLDIHAVKHLTGYKATGSIYNLMNGADFPRPVSIGRTKRWLEDEVRGWIQARIEESRA